MFALLQISENKYLEHKPNQNYLIMNDLNSQIIKAAYNVHNTLGAGYLEKVYKNAMIIELEEMGINFEYEFPIKVRYKQRCVGEYIADIIVEDSIIIELKAVENLHVIHEVQLVNYLQGTGIETGLLINFGTKVTIKKKFRTYERRDSL
jgi:GxxExxY protein